MKIRKIWVWLFFIFNYCSYANQQELNREERRIREEEIRKLEKIEAKDEIQLNELEENIEAIGDEIRNIEINGNTILKASEIEILKKKYIGKIGGKNILNLMRELDILAGETLGGSIIEIDNQRSKKISGAINYNDLGQKSTGRDRLKTSLIFEDIMGLNDSFTGTYQKKLGTSTKYKDNENFSFYYRIPIKYWEFSVSKDQSEYLSTIRSFAHTYESTGISKNINYSVRKIINRNSNGKTSVGVTLTNKETKNYFDGIKLITSSRKLSVLKVDINHNRRLFNGVFYGNLAYHEGLDRFGAESDKEKGEYSPKAQFQKYTADISWYRPFNIGEQRFSYRVSLSGQYSDDILYSSEKLGIGDDTTIRGFKENSIMGDKGFYMRNEIGYNYKFLEPFIAYDYGRVKDVYKDEYYKKNGSEMSGASIGLRMYFNHFDMSFTYSKPLTAPSYIKKNTHEIYFTMSVKF